MGYLSSFKAVKRTIKQFYSQTTRPGFECRNRPTRDKLVFQAPDLDDLHKRPNILVTRTIKTPTDTVDDEATTERKISSDNSRE